MIYDLSFATCNLAYIYYYIYISYIYLAFSRVTRNNKTKLITL